MRPGRQKDQSTLGVGAAHSAQSAVSVTPPHTRMMQATEMRGDFPFEFFFVAALNLVREAGGRSDPPEAGPGARTKKRLPHVNLNPRCETRADTKTHARDGQATKQLSHCEIALGPQPKLVY